jgi:hypothetical protein
LQKKIQIMTHGVATIYHKDALQFVLRWKESMRVHESWIDAIERVAARCPLWPQHMAEQDFGDSYRQAPDLAAALLNFLRKKLGRLEKSKAGKLKKFLSQNPVVKWDDSFNSREAVEEANKIQKYLSQIAPKVPPGGRATTKADYEHLALSRTMWANRKHSGPVPDTVGNVPIWDLQEQEIQRAVEKLPWGIGVTIDDIVKARKWVVANQRAGKRFAKKVLDKDGFLHVKSKTRRRKKSRRRK